VSSRAVAIALKAKVVYDFVGIEREAYYSRFEHSIAQGVVELSTRVVVYLALGSGSIADSFGPKPEMTCLLCPFPILKTAGELLRTAIVFDKRSIH
jgi:hypothetical protein